MPKRKQVKWDWRAHLTPEEAQILAKADAARAKWAELNKARVMITNRAINRAKYRALSGKAAFVALAEAQEAEAKAHGMLEGAIKASQLSALSAQETKEG